MRLKKVYQSLRPWAPSWPCELCGAPAGRAGICVPCHADLPWIGAACLRCARPRPGPTGCCTACHRDPPPWTRVIAPLAWRFPVDALVSRFKYRGALHLGAMLGRLLADRCAGREPGIVLPVPLHPARRRERGFNQAQEIARPVAVRTGAPLRTKACCRVVDTPAQAGLSAERRYRNLQGAFRVDPGLVEGQRVALVDDVFTTGSTVRALAEALLHAGALEVEAWAVARGGTSQAGVKV